MKHKFLAYGFAMFVLGVFLFQSIGFEKETFSSHDHIPEHVPLLQPQRWASKSKSQTHKKHRMLHLKGFASTYGSDPFTGYVDPYDNNLPALSGKSNNTPGIAVMNKKTLGGWWKIQAPNGRVKIVQQTDLGPASWTHNTFDINAVAARKLFALEQGIHFPTKQGTWHGWYLGKKQ